MGTEEAAQAHLISLRTMAVKPSHKFCSLVHFFRLCRGPWAAKTEDMAWREELDDQIPRHGELF